ncbi:hypothetical protein F4780DRAFT_494505 [Xylariomycetidae sp. FL0641]|nr:hypothetical protein F4780DRAFT_494505 [Xylariomycetidae sp. FL0641]
MPSDDWGRHRDAILCYYGFERRPLREVMSLMKEKHGFVKTKPQYEYQFKKWGVRKNMTKAHWDHIRHLMESTGRVPEVRISGATIPTARLQRETRRHSDIPTAAEFSTGKPIPTIPKCDEIRLRSPSPMLTLTKAWPNELPWFRFLREARLSMPSTSRVSIQTSHSVSGPHDYSPLWIALKGLEASQLSTEPMAFTHALASLARDVPGHHPGILENISSLTRPEVVSDEVLKTLLYHFSNKNIGGFCHSDYSKMDDQVIIQLTRTISANNPRWFNNILSTRCHTTDAIKEVIYQSAVRLGDCAVVSQLLESGVPTGLPVNEAESFIIPSPCRRGALDIKKSYLQWRRRSCALEQALLSDDMQFANILMACSARVTHTTWEAVACNADPARALELGRLLLRYEENASNSHLAIRQGLVNAFSMAIARNCNALAKLISSNATNLSNLLCQSVLSNRGTGVASLSIAIMTGNTEMADHIFEHLTNCSIHFVTKARADAIIISCLTGDKAMVMKLFQMDNWEINLNDGWYDDITPLLATSWNPDLELANKLLDMGANPDPSEGKGPTALHIAAQYGNTNFVQQLMESGVDVNAGYRQGYRHRYRQKYRLWHYLTSGYLLWESTPLCNAVAKGHTGTAALLSSQAIVFGTDLLEAFWEADQEISSMLISRTEQQSMAKEPHTRSLEAAAATGQPNTVQRVISLGVPYDPQALSTAVQCAIARSKIDSSGRLDQDVGLAYCKVVGLLANLRSTEPIDKGFEMDALLLSIHCGQWAIAGLLTGPPFLATSGLADPANWHTLRECRGCMLSPELRDFWDQSYVTPFQVSFASGNAPFIKRILDHGYRPTPLDVMEIMCMENPKSDAARKRFSEVFPLKQMSLDCQQAALLAAVGRGDFPSVQQCIACIGSPNFYCQWPPIAENEFIIDDHSTTPLQLAVEKNRRRIVEYLCSVDADVNAKAFDGGGATALQYAAINGNMTIAMFLLEQGAEVNAPPARNWGRTALEGAAEHGKLDMIHLLLDNGASLHNSMRVHYVRAVRFAIEETHWVLAAYLRSCGGWYSDDQALFDLDHICWEETDFWYDGVARPVYFDAQRGKHGTLCNITSSDPAQPPEAEGSSDDTDHHGEHAHLVAPHHPETGSSITGSNTSLAGTAITIRTRDLDQPPMQTIRPGIEGCSPLQDTSASSVLSNWSPQYHENQLPITIQGHIDEGVHGGVMELVRRPSPFRSVDIGEYFDIDAYENGGPSGPVSAPDTMENRIVEEVDDDDMLDDTADTADPTGPPQFDVGGDLGGIGPFHVFWEY